MTKEQKEAMCRVLSKLAFACILGALTGCVLGVLQVPFPIKIEWLGLK